MAILALASVYVVSAFAEEVIYRGFLITRITELAADGEVDEKSPQPCEHPDPRVPSHHQPPPGVAVVFQMLFEGLLGDRGWRLFRRCVGSQRAARSRCTDLGPTRSRTDIGAFPCRTWSGASKARRHGRRAGRDWLSIPERSDDSRWYQAPHAPVYIR